MAGDWIKMRTNLWDDPRVSRICDITGLAEAQVIGAQTGPNEVEHEKPLAWYQHLWLCYKNPFNLLLTVLATLWAGRLGLALLARKLRHGGEDARYTALDEHRCRVEGALWVPAARPSVKIEGATRVGERALLLAGCADPSAIARIKAILPEVEQVVRSIVAGDYRMYFRVYGIDGVVDWPLPLGPAIASTSPGPARTDTCSSAARPRPNDRVT